MKKETKKDIRNYLTVSAFIAGLDMVRTIVVANLMSPYFVGLCTTLMSIPQIFQYANVGTIESLSIVIPKHDASQKHKINSLKNTVLNYTCLSSILCFVSVMIYLAFFPSVNDFINYSTILAASLIVLWEIRQFFVANYIIEQKVAKLSQVELFFTVALTLLQVTIIPIEGIYGFWLPLLFLNFIIMIYSGREYFKNNPYIPFKINVSELKKIMPLGMLMLMTSVSYAPFIIGARIFIAGTVGVHEVGLFFLAITMISKIAIIPSSIAKIVLPRISGSQNNAVEEDSQNSLFVRSQLYTLLVGISVIVLGLIVINPLVPVILPQFVSGIPAARMMFFAALPYILVDNANNIILGNQHKKTFTKNLVQALILQWALYLILFLTHSISALNVSTCFILVFCYYAALTNYHAFKILSKNPRHLKSAT